MEKIVVAAVQSGVDPRWTPTEWANHLRWQLAACREAQAQLAVFPAWTGAYQESYPRGFPEDGLGTLLRLLGDLACEAGLHLVPGTIPVRTANGVTLRSFLIAPTGELLGSQDQLCPPKGYAPGRSVAVFPSTIGRVGIVIDNDIAVPEVGRLLALQGADLFCVPLALASPYNSWRQTAGAWQIVQANQVPAVEACLVGEFGGSTCAGRSRIVGTVEMTPDGTGCLSEASSLTQTEIVVGLIDYGDLTRVRDAFPIYSGLNADLYRRKMPDVYAKMGSRPPNMEKDCARSPNSREVGRHEQE